ncbi:MAG: trypsin-like peptidase domain-containing protein, partial [Aureliella sp.]
LGMSKADQTLPDRVQVVLNSGSAQESVFDAEVQGVNVERDLAYLKVPRQENVQSLSLRPSKEITETLPVYILGFPLGEGLDLQQGNPSVTVSTGHVSSLRRDQEQQISQIQIDGSLIPGNSGGPIVDAKGELVAVSVAAILGANIGFSIPGDIVQADLDGRITSVDYQHEVQGKGGYTIKANVQTVDPLGRIKRLAVYYWTSRIGAARPRDPQGTFGTYGAPGDGPRKHIELKLDRETGTWTGQISRITLRPTEDFWIQPAAATSKGVRRAAATNQGEFLRRATAGAPAPSATAAMRPSRRTARSRGGDPNPTPLPLTPRRQPSEDVARQMLTEELERRFARVQSQAKPEPVTPASETGLSATRETDDSGAPYALARTKASTVSLGDSKLLQMLADPSGRRLFVILQGQAKVFVFDPADMKLQQEIPVARFPVALWCDAERLVVACDESRLIAYIDTETLKPVATVRIPGDTELQPVRIVGRVPDGSLMTLWLAPKVGSTERWLYLVNENRETLKVIVRHMSWCEFLSPDLLWTQSAFNQSPSGNPELWSFTDGPRASDKLFNAFGRSGLRLFGCSCGRSFLSEDGKSFIIPTEAKPFMKDAKATDVRTLVVTRDLSMITHELDATVLYEYPSEDCYVAWRAGKSPLRSPLPPPEILYYSRSSGRIVRKILVDDFIPNMAIFAFARETPTAVFVPGHELLLAYDDHSPKADIHVIRCGPITGAGDVAAEAGLAAENPPPKQAVVGRALVYKPNFARPAAARSVVFRIVEGVEGMQIDPDSGEITFIPKPVNLGVYDIRVVASVDGIDVPVLKWRLEIDLAE